MILKGIRNLIKTKKKNLFFMMQKKLEKLFLILKKIHLIEDRDLNKVMEE